MERIIFISFFFFFVFFAGYSEELNDSVYVLPSPVANMSNKAVLNNNHTIGDKVDTIKVDTVADQKFKPDPAKVIWLGAIVPGYGQIANRKYWKLPIVYAGYLGFAYAISWNNSRYNSYRNAYRDIIDTDPSTNSFLKILPKGYTIETYPGGISSYRDDLNSAQEAFHRYRDMSILLSVGYYALVLLEAYVDAHLYDFDISPDLVLNVVPSRIQLEHNSRSAYGLQCSIRF